MTKNFETILRKPAREMTIDERIVGDRIPRRKIDRITLVIGLLRSEVHLPTPGIISRDFSPTEQEKVLEELKSMSSKQLALKIREERQRLSDEVEQQRPRGLTMF